MAKRKTGAVKSAISKIDNSKAKVTPSDLKTVRTIQEKYKKPIRQPKREIEKINKELRKTRQPLYSLRAKLKKETTKGGADKLRREIRKYEKAIDKPVDDLIGKRKDVRYLEKKFVDIRQEKTRKRNLLKKYDDLIEKAYENNDYKEQERLTFLKIKELGKVDEYNELLGLPVLKEDVSDYETEEEKDKKGFTEDPSNPLTIWEAIEQMREDRNSGEWKFIIIEGEKISTKDMIQLASRASTFWMILKQTKTRTPHVLRYFNVERKIVKYESYK